MESTVSGSGLGLAIARQVVQRMGGELELESASNQGSRFWFELSLKPASEADVLQPDHPFSMPDPFGAGKRILLIEDNSFIRDYLSEFLAVTDFDVEYADNLEQGLSSVCGQPFNAVLITGELPQRQAWEFLLKVRESNSTGAPVIVLCSAMPLQSQVEVPAEISFDGFLLKPINAEKLLRELQRTLVSQPMKALA
jgi:CheY-like chemotaxis protein